MQGVLSLQKQDGDVGGSHCVPYLFEHFEEWVKTQSEDRDPLHPAMTGLSAVNIDMEPDDLMVFNWLLAHGVRPNHSDKTHSLLERARSPAARRLPGQSA